MPMTEYETAYLAHLAADLAFRREQEAAQQQRHAETQAYGVKTQAYGERALEQAQTHHDQRMAASKAETAAQNARAIAEAAMAKAAEAAAAAQEAAARMLVEDPVARLLDSVIKRLDDRTSPTGKADPAKAVDDVMGALGELRRRFVVGAGLVPQPVQ